MVVGGGERGGGLQRLQQFYWLPTFAKSSLFSSSQTHKHTQTLNARANKCMNGPLAATAHPHLATKPAKVKRNEINLKSKRIIQDEKGNIKVFESKGMSVI